MQQIVRRPVEINTFRRVRTAAAVNSLSPTAAIERVLLFAVICLLWAAVILAGIQAVH